MNQMCRIHRKLIPYIQVLTSHEFGLQGAQAEIGSIECGSIVKKREVRCGDRFFIRILYCTRKLNWQVIMCPNNLMEPPDFIMEDDFLADADAELIESQVPSLANWQPSDPKCLLNVVLELLQLYKHFQGKLIKPDSRLRLEYKALLHVTKIPLSDLEMYIYNSARASFLTNLEIDYSKLPIPIPKQKYLTLLLIELGETTKNITSLMKHGDLDDVYRNIDLPELEADMMLMDYIPFIQNYLQAKVDEMVWRLNQRKIFYSLLLQVFEPAILNGDNITYKNISFLFERNGSFYVLNIQIPLNFPDDLPEISILSMSKSNCGGPIFLPLDKLRYGSERDIEKIFQKIYQFIRKVAIPH